MPSKPVVTQSKAWESLRFRMPLLITTLVTLVLAVFLWVSNREVERATLFAGSQRALVAASQLSSLLEQSGARGLAELQRLSSDSVVRQFLVTASADLAPQVQQRLRPLATNGQPAPILMNDAGETLLVIAGASDPGGAAAGVPAPSGIPSSTGVGPLRVANGVLFSDVVAEVRELADDGSQGPARRLGFVIARRIIQAGPNSDLITRLVGNGATLAVGNRADDVWTDFTVIRPRPPVPTQQASIATYRGEDGELRIGGVSPIGGTPWAVWIEFPRDQILAPARAAIRRLGLLAIVVIVVSGLLVAVLSRRITRPLHDLTEASEAMAAGEYSQKVALGRRDEIGRLGAAFNTMAERVADAQRELESRVRQRTASLEETRAQLDHFFSLSPDMLCIADMEGRFVRVNEAWGEQLGWTTEELTSKPYAEFVHPDDRSATTRETGRLADGQPTTRFENRYLCRDGSYRWLSWRAAPIVSRGLVYGAARDVTDRKRFERELEQRATQLAAVNAELEAFSYSVSHDLRAPLRHISGFVALLKASALPKLDAEEARRLQTITDAAGRMGRLIDDLLAFSRMGRTPLGKRRVNLAEVFDDVRRELAADLNGRRVTWKRQALPAVEADPAMLRLVVMNLLSNALKYSRDRQDACIEIGERNGSGDETVVFVRDNGVGFDMQYVDKLFGVFQRLHRPEDFEGTGIGLANVRRIITRHGGRTWAEGAVQAGATFFFSLPRA